MAEYCAECYKKYLDPDAKEENLLIDKELDLCEGCGQYKHTVIMPKSKPIISLLFNRFKP